MLGDGPSGALEDGRMDDALEGGRADALDKERTGALVDADNAGTSGVRPVVCIDKALFERPLPDAREFDGFMFASRMSINFCERS